MSEQGNPEQANEQQQSTPPPPPPPPPSVNTNLPPATADQGQAADSGTQQSNYPPVTGTPSQSSGWQDGPDAAQTMAMPVATPHRESVVPSQAQSSNSPQAYGQQRHAAPAVSNPNTYSQPEQTHPPQQDTDEPKRKRSVGTLILVASLALLIGLGGGYAARMFTTDATASDEYKSQQKQLKEAEGERDVAVTERDTAQEAAEAAEAKAATAEERAGDSETALTEMSQELALKTSELDERERELDEREITLERLATDGTEPSEEETQDN